MPKDNYHNLREVSKFEDQSACSMFFPKGIMTPEWDPQASWIGFNFRRYDGVSDFCVPRLIATVRNLNVYSTPLKTQRRNVGGCWMKPRNDWQGLASHLKIQQFSSFFNCWSSFSCFSSPYYVFATVPDSWINSWESWFLFNLQKINTNQYHESDSLDAGTYNTIRECTIYKTTMHILLYILEQQSSWSTSRIHPSWPRSRLKLSPILASPYEHASCCHAQPSIFLFIATGQVSHLAPSAIWVASH
jgi:hypothetical protein